MLRRWTTTPCFLILDPRSHYLHSYPPTTNSSIVFPQANQLNVAEQPAPDRSKKVVSFVPGSIISSTPSEDKSSWASVILDDAEHRVRLRAVREALVSQDGSNPDILVSDSIDGGSSSTPEKNGAAAPAAPAAKSSKNKDAAPQVKPALLNMGQVVNCTALAGVETINHSQIMLLALALLPMHFCAHRVQEILGSASAEHAAPQRTFAEVAIWDLLTHQQRCVLVHDGGFTRDLKWIPTKQGGSTSLMSDEGASSCAGEQNLRMGLLCLLRGDGRVCVYALGADLEGHCLVPPVWTATREVPYGGLLPAFPKAGVFSCATSMGGAGGTSSSRMSVGALDNNIDEDFDMMHLDRQTSEPIGML